MFDFDCFCKLKGLKLRCDVIDQVNPYMVHVMARSWDEIDMQDLVKAAAEKAGLKPTFPSIEQHDSQTALTEEEDDEEECEDDQHEDVPELVGDKDAEEANGAPEVKDIHEHNGGPAEAPEKDFA